MATRVTAGILGFDVASIDVADKLVEFLEPSIPVAPPFPQTDSFLEKSSWAKLPLPYTFSVVDIVTLSDSFGFGSFENSPFTDFELPIAPQNIIQSEDFAISIRPTQGGTTVTHSGNRYKTLTIKGTTGIHPFKGAGGALKSTGEAIFQPDKLKYRSGYEVFLRLRNWFKAYYEHKKENPIEAKDLRLIFRNFKDGEYLIVECIKFEMVRQADNPFLYNYNLDFKVLRHLFEDDIASELVTETGLFANALEQLDRARGALLRSADILRQIEGVFESTILNPLRKVSLILKTAVSLPTVAADIGRKIINETVSTLDAIAITLKISDEQNANKISGSLAPGIANIEIPKNVKEVIEVSGSDFINSFGEGLMFLEASRFPKTTLNALAEEQTNLKSIPRSFFEDLVVDINRIKSNAEDFFNLGDTALDTLLGRSATLTPASSKVATPDELDVLNALNDTLQALSAILSSESFLKNSFPKRLETLTKDFDDTLNLVDSPAVKQIVLPEGVSLEKLAQIHLKDSTRWGELAELNQLREPYVTSDIGSTVVGVAKPGDRFLIPTDIVSGFSQVPEGRITKQNKNLSELEKSLGTDFQVDKNFDLILNQNGDIALISSVENIIQAVKLKLSYEKGDLMRFPALGAGIVPGVKFPKLTAIQIGIVNTLRQDARIERIENLKLERLGSELKMSFTLKIKSVDLRIPLVVNLNS